MISYRLRLVLSCLLLTSNSAFAERPYRIAFIYDTGAKEKTFECAKTLRKTYPFSTMGKQLEFTFVEAPSEKMRCGSGSNDIARLLKCDKNYVGTVGAKAGADKIVAVSSKTNWGASGGSMVVLSSKIAPNTIVHELAHSIGDIRDEYQYDRFEAKVFCYPPIPGPNTARFEPALSAFPSDGVARTLHAADIPWYADIKSTTPIISGSELGTPGSSFPLHLGRNSDEIGLYRGGDCDLVIPTWHASQGDNAMKDSRETNLNPVQVKAILQAMEKARGSRFPQAMPATGSVVVTKEENKIAAPRAFAMPGSAHDEAKEAK